MTWFDCKNDKNGYTLKAVAVTGGSELQEVTTVSLQLGKVYGVLEKWSLMGGGRLWEGRHTWRFNNNGKKVVKAIKNNNSEERILGANTQLPSRKLLSRNI